MTALHSPDATSNTYSVIDSSFQSDYRAQDYYSSVGASIDISAGYSKDLQEKAGVQVKERAFTGYSYDKDFKGHTLGPEYSNPTYSSPDEDVIALYAEPTTEADTKVNMSYCLYLYSELPLIWTTEMWPPLYSKLLQKVPQ